MSYIFHIDLRILQRSVGWGTTNELHPISPWLLDRRVARIRVQTVAPSWSVPFSIDCDMWLRNQCCFIVQFLVTIDLFWEHVTVQEILQEQSCCLNTVVGLAVLYRDMMQLTLSSGHINCGSLLFQYEPFVWQFMKLYCSIVFEFLVPIPQLPHIWLWWIWYSRCMNWWSSLWMKMMVRCTLQIHSISK